MVVGNVGVAAVATGVTDGGAATASSNAGVCVAAVSGTVAQNPEKADAATGAATDTDAGSDAGKDAGRDADVDGEGSTRPRVASILGVIGDPDDDDDDAASSDGYSDDTDDDNLSPNKNKDKRASKGKRDSRGSSPRSPNSPSNPEQGLVV